MHIKIHGHVYLSLLTTFFLNFDLKNMHSEQFNHSFELFSPYLTV